jgi:hypothetical protein
VPLERDRQKVVVQITQNLSSRIKNKHAFELPCLYIPDTTGKPPRVRIAALPLKRSKGVCRLGRRFNPWSVCFSWSVFLLVPPHPRYHRQAAAGARCRTPILGQGGGLALGEGFLFVEVCSFLASSFQI